MSRPALVPKKLSELFELLNPEDLRLVTLAAEQEIRNRVRASHPQCTPHLLGYCERVAMLRERLDPAYWVPFRLHGQEGVESRNGNWRILTAKAHASDEAESNTLTTWMRGSLTRQAVEANACLLDGRTLPDHRQGLLFGEHKKPALTAILFVQRNGERVTGEICIPTDVKDDGRHLIWTFRERFCFLDEDLAPPTPKVDEDRQEKKVDFEIDER